MPMAHWLRRFFPVRAAAAFAVFVLVAGPIPGGEIFYEKTDGRVRVIGFPRHAPATPEDLLAADRDAGWGVVRYETETDTCRIEADLWIGNDNACDTFFQLGDSDHPRARLVVAGDLWIRPPRTSPLRKTDKRFAFANAFLSGDPEDPAIRPEIRIRCDTPQEHGLFVGLKKAHGGTLVCYNTVIGPERSGDAHRLRGFAYRNARTGYIGGLWAHEIALVGCTVSGFAETLLLRTPTLRLCGVERNNFRIRNTRFLDCGAIRFFPNTLSRYVVDPVDEIPDGIPTAIVSACRFERIARGISSYMPLTFERCVFAGNVHDINLIENTDPTIVLVSTRLSGPDSASIAFRDRNPKRPGPFVKIVLSPVVEVLDETGQPIESAIVQLLPEEPGLPDGVLLRDIAVTGFDGRTPDAIINGALLAVRSICEPAGEGPWRKTEPHEFSLSIIAAGFREARVLPGRDAFMSPVVKVVLSRKERP